MDSDIRNWLADILQKEVDSFDEEIENDDDDEEEDEEKLDVLRSIIDSLRHGYDNFTREAYEQIIYHLWQERQGINQNIENYEQRIYYSDLVEVTCGTCGHGFYATREEKDFDTQADHAHPWQCSRCNSKKDDTNTKVEQCVECQGDIQPGEGVQPSCEEGWLHSNPLDDKTESCYYNHMQNCSLCGVE
jgi:hypothetical protein